MIKIKLIKTFNVNILKIFRNKGTVEEMSTDHPNQ